MPMRSPFFAPGFQIATFEACSGISLSTMPPGWLRCGLPRACFFATLMPATSTVPSGRMSPIVPVRPLSFPDRTTTSSPLRNLFMAFEILLSLEHFRCEGNDLHEPLVAQLARHRPEDAGADRLQLRVQQHGGIAVEADQRSVRTTHAEGRAHHDGVIDLALLHLAARDGVLHADLDDIAHRCVTAMRATQHLDAHQSAGAAVVSGREH